MREEKGSGYSRGCLFEIMAKEGRRLFGDGHLSERGCLLEEIRFSFVSVLGICIEVSLLITTITSIVHIIKRNLTLAQGNKSFKFKRR